ncbi:uncharacterized protein [Phaseolus vulgaris]|uniref:uncharacterized protein n=1 Tax=Phaseolus vulgaris TaxID=3885 RepID=UPI0035CC0550
MARFSRLEHAWRSNEEGGTCDKRYHKDGENVAASRSEQERIHEALVASQARNEELNRVNEELHKALQGREERATGDRSALPSPPRSFPMPFSQEIMDTVVPANAVAVKASFTGVEDPEAHLTAFHTQMMLSRGSDATYCKVFMSTLSGTALDWFVSLPTGDITTFQQFSKMFIEQYIVNKAPPLVSYELFDVRQYQGESLKDFLNRFGAQIVRWPGKDEDMFVHAFKKGMLHGSFSESLIRSHPATFAEIRRRVVAHIAAESEVSEKIGNVAPAKPRAQTRIQPQRVMEAAAGKKDQRMHHPYDPKKSKGKGPGRPRESNRPPRYEFVMGLGDLIAIPNIAARLKVPEKTTDKVLGPKPDAWCEFHESFGHSINSCLALGYQLAELVKCGFLKDYLLEKQTGRSSGSQLASGEGQQHEVPIHGEIHTIAGGFSGGGCTASKQKKYARSVMSVEAFEDHSPDVDITFTKEDLRDVVPHDNDPIVISLVTAGRMVHRVLVDQGSSADVMGYIELRTTFTDGLASRTEKIRYLVVNAPSAYNILLGRPTLNRIGAVPSTRHMKVKLPSMEGVVITIRSDQKEAKKCYENSLKNKRSVCHVTTTPPPGVEPEQVNRLVVDTAFEVAAERDGVMVDVEAMSENAAWVEEEKNCPEVPRESGIARALIASEKRPQPVKEWLEKKTGGKMFKLGKTLDVETRDQIVRVPFGLKNAGATYQRLMDKVLAPMLGRNVQAYVDDMVVTSLEKSRHVTDLEELFVTIAKYKLKLNPEKCIFGVEAGKFLGFLLTERGIEANPDKCAAILAMRSPATVKEVQQLTGRMAALSRFVSASGEKGHPYFQCLKRNNRFVWTRECEEAFVKLKEYLASPPVLCKPQMGMPLRLYFAITEKAISAVLVQDQDQVQKPIYLQDPEVRYQALEKAALAVVFSARRLRHYFQSFTVLAMTDLPIQKVLKKPDVAGRMVKWAVELSEFDIKYEPRGPIKGQIFADFVVERSSETVQSAGDDFRWVLSVDGSSNQLGSGAGVILEGPNGVLIEQSVRFAFKASNNQAEYEALIVGILLAKEMGAKVLMAKSDSLLVTGQVTGKFQAKDPQMAAYLEYVQELKRSPGPSNLQVDGKDDEES